MLIASQRPGESSKAVANVLMLAKVEQNIAIQLIPLIRDKRPYERIIVSEQSQIRLDGKCVGELRYLQSHNRTDHSIPQNLQNPSGSAENRPSNIWAAFSSLPLGRRRNMEPRRHSRSPSKTLVPRAPGSCVSAASTSLLPPSETQKIESWADNIEETVNPNEIAVEPPKDNAQDEAWIGRRRRLATEDSDSNSDSDSDDEQIAPAETVLNADPTEGDQLVLPADSNIHKDSREVAGNALNVTQSSAIAPEEQPQFKSDDSADEAYAPTSMANPPKKTARRRRVTTADSDNSNNEESSFAITKAILKEGQATSRTAKEASAGISSPSRRDPSTTSASPFSPVSFNLNAYHGGGNGVPSKARGAEAQPQTPGRGIGIPSSPRVGASHAQNQAENVHDGRSVTKQDTGSQGRNRGQTKTRGSGRGPDTSPNSPRGGRQPGRGQPTQHGRSRGHGFNRGRGNTGGMSRSYSSEGSLVDIPAASITGPIMPPPGFNYRFKSPEEASPQSPNLLEEPLRNIQKPSNPLANSSSANPPPNPPLEAGRSPHNSSSSGRLYVNTFNPRPDVAAMEEEQLQMLLAQREKLARKSRPSPPTFPTAAEMGSTSLQAAAAAAYSPENMDSSFPHATLQAEDEVATRRFHRTMNQRAPNPGKKGKSRKPEETKKERDARIAKAKAEAHGEISVARKPRKPSPKLVSSSDEVDKDMSARKRQALKKSGLMAETDRTAAEDELRRSQAINLIDSLTPLFEAGRAFSGKLRLEVQFGQVISSFPSNGGQYQFIDLQEWHRRFHPRLGMRPEVASFTNILTTNGADADRILDMKSPSPGSITVWSRTEPVEREVTYEFQCQTMDNEEFWLVVSQNGRFEIRPSSATVGMANLHFPGQIWDACAIFGGVMNHQFSDAVIAAAATFVSSLYIPPGLRKISITYRLPDTNEMTVRNLIMKRKSMHNCNMPGKRDFQLQITEVQTLYHQFHKNDKKLGQGFVKDFSQMVNEGRLHYEVSLVHKGINELLEENANLELGELTDAWAAAEILSMEAVKNMVDLTTLVVSKIDGIGSKNIGTLFRKEVEQLAEERPSALDAAAAPVSRAALSRLDLDAASHIQGVRGGRADIVWDNGQPYAFGFGGALVPIMDRRESSSDEVVPDDSASQVGGTAGPHTPIKIVHPGQVANISTTVQPRGGYGFW
jgi:hypothetical protein